jgi:subtilisin family serine protease
MPNKKNFFMTSIRLRVIAILTILLNFPFFSPAQEDPERDILIAIIDTGADIEHPLIKNNIWTNPNEILNGVDDDGNGLVDDIHGWNFVSNNNNLSDNNGHGTHVAGIIQQRTENSRIKYLILKYYHNGKNGEDTVGATAKAIQYATKMKADIINYSGGGYHPNKLEKKALQEAEKQGILFVAAAGNDGIDTNQIGYYPASYHLNNILSVAALDDQKKLLGSSNFGSQSVDLAAPGKKIFSSLPGGQYGYMSGTSQATAWVSGLAAKLLLQKKPLQMKPLNPESLKELLKSHGTADPTLVTKTKSHIRLKTIHSFSATLTEN